MEEIFGVFEKINYLLIFIALGLNIYVIKTFGKGILNILFVSFGMSIFFVGAYLLFAFLNSSGVYHLSDVTSHVWSHIIVYLALLSMIWGGYRIKGITDSGFSLGFSAKDNLVYGIFFVVMIFVFIAAPGLEDFMSVLLTDSVVDKFGLHHFSTFILGIIAAWYLFYIKGKWGILGTSISLMIGFLMLIGIQHLWETVTESQSLRLFDLDEVVVEGVEMVIILPALMLLGLAQWKIVKYVREMNSVN